MTPAQIALTRAQVRLTERLANLEPRLDAGEDVWDLYSVAATALAAIAPHTEPGTGGRLMTTAELAERLDVSSRTIFRRSEKKGAIQPARRVGRGRRSVLWPAEAAR